MSQPITILLVAKRNTTLHDLRAALAAQADFAIGAAATCCPQAVQLVAQWIPELVLWDDSLAGPEAAEAVRRIRAASPRTRVVTLFHPSQVEAMLPVLQAGASAYFDKTCGWAGLPAALQRVAHGEGALHPLLAARALSALAGAPGAPLFSRDFTEPELAVLRLTAAGVEPEEIARRLDAPAHTVAGHISNILAKLHLADRAEQALDAFKVGF